MRFLIVNAHSRKGALKFQFFEQTIIKVIFSLFYLQSKIIKQQKELIDTENEFFIRDKDNIDDFLFEEESSFIRKDSANRFDQIDLIFIQGDANLRPWSQNAQKLLILLRMCLKTKKYVFGSSFAMQALVFLTATNLTKVIFFELITIKPVNILNGIEGGKLSEITCLRFKHELKLNDFFLDNTTGDLYQYNYESKEWLPKANVGMHQRRAAQEYQSIGKYIVKAPTYKAKEVENEGLYKNTSSETICYLKKTYLNNHFFKDIPQRFLIPLINSWDVHAFSFTSQKNFKSIAESDWGITIISFPTILCVQFDISEKYPESLQILQNFIISCLNMIKNSNYFSPDTIIQKHDFSQSAAYTQLKMLNEKNKKKSIPIMIKGFVSLQEESDEENYFQKDQISRKINHVGFSISKQRMPNIVSFNSITEKKIRMSEIYSKKQNFGSEIQFQNLPTQFTVVQEEDDQSKPRKLTCDDIRQFLHPSLSPENARVINWVPGQYTKTHYNTYRDDAKKINRTNINQFVTRNFSKGSFASQFHQSTDQDNSKVPCSPKPQSKFLTIIQNLDKLPQSETPSVNHQFREQDKSRWLSKKGFHL